MEPGQPTPALEGLLHPPSGSGRSATPAIPPMIVRKTIGPISIFIAVMNVVPIGSMSVARSGHFQPSTMPITIATSTWTYNWRYHGFAAIRAACSARPLPGVRVIATSLSRATPSPIGPRRLWATVNPGPARRVHDQKSMPRIGVAYRSFCLVAEDASVTSSASSPAPAVADARPGTPSAGRGRG
jgi:hypothetical protein